jgi:hypothetical protein
MVGRPSRRTDPRRPRSCATGRSRRSRTDDLRITSCRILVRWRPRVSVRLLTRLVNRRAELLRKSRHGCGMSGNRDHE